MFTDIHTHAFHPKIARHAVEHLNEAYQLDCVGEGTIADLLLREKRSGIGRETDLSILDHYTQKKNIMINLNETPSGFYPEK